MTDFTLYHVYQLTDFDLSEGHIAPPDAPMCFHLHLNAEASPVTIHITGQEILGETQYMLTASATLDGMFYPAGSAVKLNYRVIDQDDFEGFSISIGQAAIQSGITTAFLSNNAMTMGKTHQFMTDKPVANDAAAYQEFACFTRGTKIKTSRGECAIEDLQIGDRVITRDHGLQPVRWTGQRTLPAMGVMAPIEIDAGTLGCTTPLRVSPKHRMLISGAMAELICGEEEMLISAQNLVNERNVRRVEGGFVTYVHIMFDYHEVIWANDCPSESFYAGDDALNCLNPEQANEIIAIFPKLSPATKMQSMARSECRSYEASLISATL